MFLLIPYKRLVIDTSLTPDQVAQLLSTEVKPWRPFHNNVGGFEGEIEGNGFKIWRAATGRNSFTPVLYGKFYPTAEGTQIQVALKLHSLVAIALIAWISPCWLLWIDYYLKGNPPTLWCLTPFVLSLLLYLFIMLFFNLELGRSIRLLRSIFDPYEITP